MEPSTLAKILDVEKEIRARLDVEREQASAWLENARREVDTAHAADLASLRAELQRRRAAALQADADRASAMLREHESAIRRQSLAGDDELRALLRRHLAVIVPGAAR